MTHTRLRMKMLDINCDTPGYYECFKYIVSEDGVIADLSFDGRRYLEWSSAGAAECNHMHYGDKLHWGP